MGRKRLPTNVHVLQGTYQPCRHGPKDAQPLLPGARIQPPEWLSEDGKTEWKRVVDLMAPLEVITEGDQAVLLGYVLLYCDLVKLGQEGLPSDPAKVAQMRLAAAELGLTPSARAKLSVSRGKKDNPFGELEGGPQSKRPGTSLRPAG